MTKTFCDGCGAEVTTKNSFDVRLDNRNFSMPDRRDYVVCVSCKKEIDDVLKATLTATSK